MATGTPRHTWTDGTTAITAAKLNALEQDIADGLATALEAAGDVTTIEGVNQNQYELINSAFTELGAHDTRLDTLEAKIGNLTIVKLTEAQYTALVTKDANTLYLRTA